MATQRTDRDPRLAAQASVLKTWGQEWRKAHGKGQQDLGRAAGYGSDESPKSAAVAVSRIESGKTDPTGRYRQRLLEALGHPEAELKEQTERALAAPPKHNAAFRALAGPVYVENEERRAQIITASNRLTQRVTFQLENSGKTLDQARKRFILPFLETAAKVDWQPLLDAKDVRSTDGKPGSHEDGIRGLREQTQFKVLKAVTESAAGAIAGAGVGAGTAAGVFAAVSTAATASTGTAIASLSGAAASSATLAWLGGGSLAAGGMGVAGGTVVLTGIVALPALLAVGGVLVWKGRKLRKEAEAEAEKLDAAQQALEDMQSALSRAEIWDDAQQAIIQRAEMLGRTIQSRWVEPSVDRALGLARNHDVAASRQIKLDQLPRVAQEGLEVELQLLGVILDTRALPLWLGVTTVSQPELSASQERTAAASVEWIEESLALAQFDLDQHEEWLNSLIAQDSLN
jgi:transcriptional regulator with XRE-family HTH domain